MAERLRTMRAMPRSGQKDQRAPGTVPPRNAPETRVNEDQGGGRGPARDRLGQAKGR